MSQPYIADNIIYCRVVDNINNLEYVGGMFKYVGGELDQNGKYIKSSGIRANGIAIWNRITKTWSPLEDDYTGNGVYFKQKYKTDKCGVLTMILDHDKKYLYIGGNFVSTGGFDHKGKDSLILNNIARWNIRTKSWEQISDKKDRNGIKFNSPRQCVMALTIDSHRNILYIGGRFVSTGHRNAMYVNHIISFDLKKKEWINLSDRSGTGFNNNPVNSGVMTLLYHKPSNSIYVGGRFTKVVNRIKTSNIIRWDIKRKCWSPLLDEDYGAGFYFDSSIDAIYTLCMVGNNKLYVGGRFKKTLGEYGNGKGGKIVNNVAYWDLKEHTWNALCDKKGIGIKYNTDNKHTNTVYTLYYDDTKNYLWIAGAFDRTGKTKDNNYLMVSNIAQWNLSSNEWIINDNINLPVNTKLTPNMLPHYVITSIYLYNDYISYSNVYYASIVGNFINNYAIHNLNLFPKKQKNNNYINKD